MKLLFVCLFALCSVAPVVAQTFASISEDQYLLHIQPDSRYKNAVVVGDKIYYTTPQNEPNKFNLAVINIDGSNAKNLPNVTIIGTHYLAATNKFIYFNSYVESAKYYHLFRYDPVANTVEAVVSERGGGLWPFSGTAVLMSQMYTRGDKLVLAGTFRLLPTADFRTLAIVEDEQPIARILYQDELPNTRDYRRLELMYSPNDNDVALTDSAVYVYSMRSEKKKKMLYIYSTRKGSADQKYAVETIVDFSQFGYTPLQHQLTVMNGEVYTLIFKNDRPKDSKTAALIRFTNRHIGNEVASAELSEDALFMQPFGKELYFGNKYNIYYYDAKNKSQLIATTKGNGYFGQLQHDKRLLRTDNGTLFLSLKKCYGETTKTAKSGATKIIAIDATFRTDSVCMIEKIDCNNYFDEMPLDSCFIVGNTLCILNHNDNMDWFVAYDKKNKWAATRLDYPQVKDCKKLYTSAPTMLQLPNSILIRADYQKGRKQKKSLMLHLQSHEQGKMATSPPPSSVVKPPVKNRKPPTQIITDTAFARAVRTQCPDCINVDNKLLAAAQTLSKLELNGKNISDLTGISDFTDLEILYCGSNRLTRIPTLPKGLTDLYCFGNPLGILPDLPPTLRVLSCATNQLTALPELPKGLTILNCAVNQLTVLPSLPPMLQSLSCTENRLTMLPTLPNALKEIYTDDNQLTTLPTLPDALTQLSCSRNRLTNLPTLPPILTSLSCSENAIKSLPTLPKTLKSLYIDRNRISCLPNLVEGLTVADGATAVRLTQRICN